MARLGRSEATPLGYLQLIHDRGIGHLGTSGDQVDLVEALVKIRAELGAETVCRV